MTGVTVITDLHLRKENTKTEPNLLQTQDRLMEKITRVCSDRAELYDKHIVVFLGDICDRCLSGMTFVRVCYWIKELASKSKLYAVTGNHELTYKGRYNVFWHLGYGQKFTKSPKLETIDEVIEVVDYIDVDATRIYMNHCKQSVKFEDDKSISNVVILTHNAVIMNELEQMLTDEEDQDPKSNYVKYEDFRDFLPRTDKLKFILSGHVHSLFGQYRIDESLNGISYDFIMYYLSTLGRPKSNEFLECNNKRDLPTLEINEGSLSLVHNYIELEGREVLDEEEILTRRDAYDKTKHIKQMKKLTFSRDDIIGDLKRMYEMNMGKNLILQNAISEMPDNEIELAYKGIKEINLYE